VPKKTEGVQNEITETATVSFPAESESTPRRPSTSARKMPQRTKKSPAAGKKKSIKRGSSGKAVEPSDEDIRLRAYFISERRHRLALPGDASSDWLEAKKQLLSELGPR
jgi:hypothetical protein